MKARCKQLCTAGISLAFYYDDGQCSVRIIDNKTKPKPTFLTRHIPLSLETLLSLARRESIEIDWQSDGYGVWGTEHGVIIYQLGASMGMAIGSRSFIAHELTHMLRSVGHEAHIPKPVQKPRSRKP